MPELPEVETISRQLDRIMRGRRILGITVRLQKMIRGNVRSFKRTVIGARVVKIRRRAKLILFDLSNGWSFLVHLKMTGQLVFRQGRRLRFGGHPIRDGLRDLPNKYSHVIFKLDKGASLYFNDMRQFGFVKVMRTVDLEKYFLAEKYGPEPLRKDFTLTVFLGLLELKRVQRIKPLLMDQSFIAGVGNIYATEACFAARIKPDRRVCTINLGTRKKLFQAIISILNNAVRLGGTTAKNYTDAHGQPGRYVPKLKVYGREGELCYRCGHTIKADPLAGRGTAWCPGCQK
ncbi:MAG: bifunctional DNA-formamidopyrimidine glycosylase/DNA-(apurinic or apyrimidinic site) lyase [Patescibacteria group bacterium]|jgi:formamidopyrimidine-DNA glycosylase